MGFLDSIGELFSSVPIIGDIAGSLFNDHIADDNAKLAYDRNQYSSALQYNRYKQRYQDVTADMKSAGLNPILAASSGFNIGSGPQVTSAQAYPASSTPQSFGSTAQALATADKYGAETEKVQQDAKLVKKKILTEIQTTKNLMQQNRVLKQEELEKLAHTGVLINQHEQITQAINMSKKQQKQLDLLNTRLQALIKKIRQQGQVYDNNYGIVLSYLRETLGSIGALIQGVPVQLLKP